MQKIIALHSAPPGLPVLNMITCSADEFVPLPTGAKHQAEKLSYAEVRERAKAACSAAALLDANGYKDSPDIEFVQAVAQDMLRSVGQGNEVSAIQANAAMNTPEGCVYVESLLTAYDFEVVKDARRLRHYVTNKLIVESENPDARIRMRALELLGKISDVGLFTERTEITVNNRSTIELENSLRDKLRRLMNTDGAEDAKVISPPAKLDQIPDAREALAGF